MLLPKQTVEPAECVQPNETKAAVELQELTPKRSPPVSGVSVTSLPISTSSPLVKQQKRQLLNKPPPRMHQQQLHFIKLGGSSFTSNTDVTCVVCKRPARVNSVYCSDECIRKYAQSAIQAQTVPKTPEPTQQPAAPQPPLANALEAKKNKKKDLFEDVLRQADSMSKVERVCELV